jgi:hypothetical protein
MAAQPSRDWRVPAGVLAASRSGTQSSAQTFKWTTVSNAKSYVLVRKVAGLADQYAVVNGTSTTPAAVPAAVSAASTST